MPVLSELGTAAQVRYCVDAAVLHPEIHAAVEGWRQRDVKTTVAGHQGWVLAVFLDSLFVDYKHWDLRAIFRVVPDLLDVIGRGIDGRRIYFGPERALYVAQIHAINRGRNSEGLESK